MQEALKNRGQTLYLLSDASGNLLEHFFNAILTQFPEKTFILQSLPFIKTEERVSEAIKNISAGILFHGVRSSKLKAAVAKECAKRGIECWDVTGPTVAFLEKVSGIQSARDPKPVHSVGEKYLSRIETLEFAVQHDDSRRVEDLEKADIILVGVSRVSKSPNALFLAYRGFRVSNVTIIPSYELPEPLTKHRGKNVVALTIQPRRLSEIRERRFSKWELEEFEYGDLQSVIHEVMEAEKIYKKMDWPVIDTTDLAVEETSALILQALSLKPKLFEC